MSLCPAWQNTTLRTHSSRLVEARTERQTDRETDRERQNTTLCTHPSQLVEARRERETETDRHREKERKKEFRGRLTLKLANGLEIARCNWERNGLTFERT